VLDEAGRLDAADARYEELERIVQRESEPAVATLAALERVRARGRWLRGDLPGAVLLARNAVERLEQADRPARELLPALVMLATAENANGETEAALEHAERAERIALDRLDEYEHSFQLGQARLEVAVARRSLGDPVATAILDAAIESFVASAGEHSSETIRARRLRARWHGAAPPRAS
jgi:ATP/maltotriose-dependent transcriptional regulator MalT